MLRKLLAKLLPDDSSPTTRRATRLTIVGGRPPSEVDAPAVPEGIERTLRRAAMDRRFRRRLLRDRTKVVAELAQDLSPTEMAILGGIPDEQLEKMIQGVAPLMPERRSLIARMAAAAGFVLGGTAISQAGCGGGGTKGSRPDTPPRRGSDGARPDVPPGTKGIRPDTPPSRESEADTGVRPDLPAGTEMPEGEPEDPPKTRGISPDIPPSASEDGD
jgi:hypothetical protein